jgi:O-acetylhomoserine/O-acetylserine sulfhydrylase-like pyridoxal-dependent enzyme
MNNHQPTGGTHNQFAIAFKRLGIEVRMVGGDGSSSDEIEKLIDENTKCIYTETLSNPLFQVADLDRLSALAHSHGLPLMVDNTFGCCGYICQPIKHGADIIVESATKWIGGVSVCLFVYFVVRVVALCSLLLDSLLRLVCACGWMRWIG